jgi:NADPH2:quinone reductase
MRAEVVRVHRFGGPEQLVRDEALLPEPGQNEALVAVRIAGVNFIDVYQRTGLYPAELPRPLGLEGAGVIAAVGPGVELAVGTRVAWASVPGSYATHVVAPVDRLVPIPDGVDDARACAAMLQGMTAHYLVHGVVPLGPGHTALLHAAAGGVGLLVCQLAKADGIRVLATASTEAKRAAALAAGAAEARGYDGDVAAWAREASGGGCRVAWDSVGLTTWETSLRALARRGTLILFGQSSGSVPAFDPQLLSRHGSLYVTRPVLADYTATRVELLARAGAVLDAVERGGLTLAIDSIRPLAAVADAHRALEGRSTSGKLLLAI